MFNNKRNSIKRASSYETGKASIIVKPKIKTPLRSSSLYNPYSQEVLQLQQQIDEFEEVELVDDTSSHSSTSSMDSEGFDELSLSAAEVAASVRSSRIITHEKPSMINVENRNNSKNTKKQNRLSRLIFGWGSHKKSTASVATISEQQQQQQQQQRKSNEDSYDDGREELLYRGIQVKELKTTVNPMVLVYEPIMPQPQPLQRPAFARLNY